jgi:hypothetical protein
VNFNLQFVRVGCNLLRAICLSKLQYCGTILQCCSQENIRFDCNGNYYCRFQITFHCFQHAVPKFVANLPITLSSSEVGRELRNEVSKFISKFELWLQTNVHSWSWNYYITNIRPCARITAVKYWSSGLPDENVFLNKLINEIFTFVYNRSSNFKMNLRTSLRSSRPTSEFGNVIGKLTTNLGSALWKVIWNRQ